MGLPSGRQTIQPGKPASGTKPASPPIVYGAGSSRINRALDDAAARKTAAAEKDRLAKEAAERDRLAKEAAEKKRLEDEAKAKADADAQRKAAEKNPLYGLTSEQAEEYGRNEGLKTRFGDFGWLDKIFQTTPELLGESAASKVSADPSTIEGQKALLDQWDQIANGKGKPLWDDASRQTEQYGNLKDIIAGGGANALEMAARGKQRADSESWLRGQREADMQDYAERGLTGSGQELLALSTDRQGAAGRNSQADLQMAADLEKRRMDAIGNAGDLAGKMRDQTYLEQSFGSKALQDALTSKGGLLGDMRKSSFDEGAYRADATDSFSVANNALINGSKQDNVDFVRSGYEKYRAEVNKRDADKLSLGLDTAGKVLGSDVGETKTGFDQGDALGTNTANTYNDALAAFNQGKQGVVGGGINSILGGAMDKNSMYPTTGRVTGDTVENIIKMIAGMPPSSSTGGNTSGSTSGAQSALGGGTFGSQGNSGGYSAGDASQGLADYMKKMGWGK